MLERAVYPCLDTTDADISRPVGRGPGREDDEYLEAMANLAAAVSVVTTFGDGLQPVGATVTSAVSVSAEPPVVAVALGWQSCTLAAIRATRIFAVNILRSPAREAAQLLGTKSPEKFDGIPYEHTRLGTPWLPRLSLKAIECRLLSEVPVGDHALLLGAVIDVLTPPRAVDAPDGTDTGCRDEDRPLLHWRQSYHRLG